MNENPRVTTGITIGVVILALLLIVWQLWPEPAIQPLTKAYYTIDDGKTWFVEGIEKVPPFQHEGKEAVRAHVMMCGEDGKPFVGWMEKFTDDAKKKLDDLYANSDGKRPPERFEFEETARLVKRTEMKDWVRFSYAIADKLQTFECKEAPNTYAREIFPE
jgi:hypothetical protein